MFDKRLSANRPNNSYNLSTTCVTKGKRNNKLLNPAIPPLAGASRCFFLLGVAMNLFDVNKYSSSVKQNYLIFYDIENIR